MVYNVIIIVIISVEILQGWSQTVPKTSVLEEF